MKSVPSTSSMAMNQGSWSATSSCKRDEIGMREVRECTKLALQPEEASGVRAAQQLERDAGVTLQVEGFVDDTESALAETSLDAKALVVAQHLGALRPRHLSARGARR